jgi:hypothetical protein
LGKFSIELKGIVYMFINVNAYVINIFKKYWIIYALIILFANSSFFDFGIEEIVNADLNWIFRHGRGIGESEKKMESGTQR